MVLRKMATIVVIGTLEAPVHGMVRCCGEQSDGPKLLSGELWVRKEGLAMYGVTPLLLLPGPLLKYPPDSPLY